MRNLFDIGFGWVAASITYLFGGWTGVLNVLILFMVLDYVSGLAVAAFFQASNKSPSGGLSSKAGFQGLLKKVFTLVIIVVAYKVDTLVKAEGVIYMAVQYGYIANEGISILENLGSMGIPLPERLIDALDVLKNGGD